MASRRRTAGTRAKPDEPRRPTWRIPTLGLAFLILAAGSWAYSTSFRGVFVLDDVRAIVRNPTIRTLWPLTTALAPPAGSTVAGRPVANLSFALNYALAPAVPSEGPAAGAAISGPRPLDAAPFHAGNLVIHLFASLVLFGVVRRTLRSLSIHKLGDEPPRVARSAERAHSTRTAGKKPQPRLRFEATSPGLKDALGEASSWLALVVALIWVVHPLQTAAVTYVVQRVESLMGLFYLLTLYCAIRASASSATRWWTAAAIASCACGMATKEVMVTAPLIVAIWARLFGSARADSRIRIRSGLMAGLASTWLLLIMLVTYEHRGPSISVAWDTVWPYLLTQTEVVVQYVRLSLLPTPLVFFYDWPLGMSLGAVAWQILLLTALVILTVVGVVRRHPASFLGAWFFLILAPSSSLLPIITEVAAEHRMYLPLAAIVSFVAVTAFVAGRTMIPSPKAAVLTGALATMLVVGALGVETRARNQVYWSAEGLWQDTVTKRPSDARARVAYGDALAGAGKFADAEAQLQVAVARAPGDPIAHVRLGAVLAQQRKLDEAVVHLERALALRPGDIDAHRFLAEIYGIQRNDAAAVRHYGQALTSLPDDAQLTARLAAILADSPDMSVRNPSRACELAATAVTLTNGRDPRTIEILAVAQASAGRLTEAAATARRAADVARALGDRALVSTLEYRASAYERENQSWTDFSPKK